MQAHSCSALQVLGQQSCRQQEDNAKVADLYGKIEQGVNDVVP